MNAIYYIQVIIREITETGINIDLTRFKEMKKKILDSD
jgi:hypothetical protein